MSLSLQMNGLPLRFVRGLVLCSMGLGFWTGVPQLHAANFAESAPASINSADLNGFNQEVQILNERNFYQLERHDENQP